VLRKNRLHSFYFCVLAVASLASLAFVAYFLVYERSLRTLLV